jgi:hypothetical protein
MPIPISMYAGCIFKLGIVRGSDARYPIPGFGLRFVSIRVSEIRFVSDATPEVSPAVLNRIAGLSLF